MNHNDAEKLVRRSIREVAPDVDLDTVGLDADLRQTLRLDSLDFLALVQLLSDSSGKRIEEEDYPKLATVADIVTYLTED